VAVATGERKKKGPLTCHLHGGGLGGKGKVTVQPKCVRGPAGQFPQHPVSQREPLAHVVLRVHSACQFSKNSSGCGCVKYARSSCNTGCVEIYAAISSWEDAGRESSRIDRLYYSAPTCAILCYNQAEKFRILVAPPAHACRVAPSGEQTLVHVSSTSKLPRDANCVAILVNPKAGSGAGQQRVASLVQQLRGQAFTVEVFSDLVAAMSQANRWYAEGRLRTLVGVGGDGTIAALVNGTAEGLPITVFPAGNSNLLARHFGFSKDPSVICQTVCRGATARLDAGLANDRIFLLMVGCGFDAEVVRRVHQGRTGHVSNLTYCKPIIEAMASYPFPEIQVHWEDRDPAAVELPWSVRWFFAFNLPCYAGLSMAPHADGADGLLDVWGFRRGGVLCGLGYLAAILACRHHGLPSYMARRVGRLRLTSEAEVPYQLDGDPGGVLPLNVEILPRRLTLMIPKTTNP